MLDVTQLLNDVLTESGNESGNITISLNVL